MAVTRGGSGRLMVAGLLCVSLVTASCSSASSPSRRTVAVTPGVHVTVPVGDPTPTGTVDASGAAPLTASMRLDNQVFTSPIVILSPVVRLKVDQQSAQSGQVGLTFQLAPDPGLSAPVLLKLGAAGTWQPVPSRYNVSTHSLSASWAAVDSPASAQPTASLTSFSWLSAVWAVIGFSKNLVETMFTGLFNSLFGSLVASPPGAACAASEQSSEVVTVASSRPSGGLATCASPVDSDHVSVGLANQRSYPIDLLYPTGAAITTESSDVFAQLGGSLNRLASGLSDAVLVEGDTVAKATIPLRVGQETELQTAVDSTAYLVSVLGTGLRVLAAMGGVLAGVNVAIVLTKLDTLQCARSLVSDLKAMTEPSLQLAEQLATAGFTCLATAAGNSLFGVIATLFSLIGGLIDGIVSAAWIVIDTALGSDAHQVRIAVAPSPTAGWKVVSDPKGNYAFAIPPGWFVDGPCTVVPQSQGDPFTREVLVGRTPYGCGGSAGEVFDIDVYSSYPSTPGLSFGAPGNDYQSSTITIARLGVTGKRYTYNGTVIGDEFIVHGWMYDLYPNSNADLSILTLLEDDTLNFHP